MQKETRMMKMFWRLSDRRQEKIFYEKISSINQKIWDIWQSNASLDQQVDELNSGLNSQCLWYQYKGLKPERKALRVLTKQLEQWSVLLEQQNVESKPLEEKYWPAQAEIQNIMEANRILQQEIQEMESKVKVKELEDELKKIQSDKKTLTQENKLS